MAVPTPTPTYYFSRQNVPTGQSVVTRNVSAMQQLATDITTKIPGWTIFDNQLNVASPFIVLQANTSEQAAAFYVKFDMEANQPYGPEISMWETWNAATHSGDNTRAVGYQRWQWGPTFNVAPSQTVSYWGCGSTDHLYIWMESASGQTLLPLYVGLMDKIRPDLDTTLNGAVLMAYVYESRQLDTPSYALNVAPCTSTYGRIPYLRSKANVIGESAHTYDTTPWSQSYNNTIVRENGTLYGTGRGWLGPWNYSQAGYGVYPRTQWYRIMVSELPTSWGPRGYLKSVLFHGGAGYDFPPPHRAKVRIASRDYLILAVTNKDGGYPFDTNAWGTAGGLANIERHPSFLMPTSDWYTNAYITA